MPMHLVETPIHQDLQAAARDIAEGVNTGFIVGLGLVVMVKGGRFFVDAVGTVVRDPYASRGYVRSLDDLLRSLGERRKDANTTI